MDNILINSESPFDVLNKVGGKAFNLYLLEKEGIPVPKWLCISSELFEVEYHRLEVQIKKIIQKIELKNIENLKENSKEIENLFLSINLSEDFLKTLKESLHGEKRYAVRSSALGEDGVDNSYAGQLSTYLFTNIDQMEEKIKLCWASVFSHRNIQYRLVNEIHGSPKVGVVIQEMIDAEKSGVMFTAHPLLKENFLDQIVINAGYGVGEGIVTDQVEIDSYVFSKSEKKVIETNYNEKKQQMVQGDNGGTKLIEVEVSKQNVSVLTHNDISKLAGLGKTIRQFYGIEQDIEWCFDKQGKIYITQSRPITTIEKGINKIDFFFDNSHVVESFPGVNTPWTLGQIRDIYSISFRKACLRLGFNRKKINLQHHMFNNLIGMYQGRIFYNLTNWYSMLRFVPFTQHYITLWEELLGVSPNDLSDKNNRKILKNFFGFFEMAKIGFNTCYLFFILDYKLSKLDESFKRLFSSYWDDEEKGKHFGFTPAGSIERLESFKSELFQNADLTIINDIYAFVFSAMTKKIISKATPLNADQAFNDLLYGVSGMDSVKPLKELIKISTYVKSNDELLQKLIQISELDNFDINHFKNIIEDKTFSDLFSQYMQDFGDRGVNELKFETLTYRETPQKLLRLILSYCNNGITSLYKDDQRRLKAEEEVLKHIKGYSRKYLYRFCLKMAKRSINYRENFRLHRSRAYGILRRMTNNLGGKMKAIGDINHSRDIYFLEKGDVYNKYTGLTFSENLREKVKTNKFLYHQYHDIKCSAKYTIQQGKFHPVATHTEDVKSVFQGTACSGGQVTAEVFVVEDLAEVNKNTEIAKGKILVSKVTDPGWIFLMAVSKGLIVERGSILSHTAIIGRELGIPTVVGVKDITSSLKTGDLIELNANTGEIKLLNKEESVSS